MPAADSKPTLWHLKVSHYSEKVRWALAHKSVEHIRRAPTPGAHMAYSLWLSRGRTVTFPVLELDGKRIPDSTAIIAALEERFPDPPLYPSDPAERRRALELEDWFDEELGPNIRRLAFFELRQDRARSQEITAAALGVQSPLARRTADLFGRGFTAARFGAANPARARVAETKTLAALDRLEAELGGNEYLVGDRFTVADLTAAALFYPLVMPPEGPVAIDPVPAGFVRIRDPLIDRPGFRWVQEMFRRHRRPGSAPASAPAPAHAASP